MKWRAVGDVGDFELKRRGIYAYVWWRIDGGYHFRARVRTSAPHLEERLELPRRFRTAEAARAVVERWLRKRGFR